MDREMSADQVLAALWRRKLLVLLLFALALGLGAAVVMVQPQMYVATAVVRVEPQRPGEDMVQRTVSELIEQRLLTVRQELLARPVLQQAIAELGLYSALVKEKGLDAAVERMRADLTVRVEGESAFEIAYASVDPELAAKAANLLPEIYAKQATHIRQAQASRVTALFDHELSVLKRLVSDWERKIAQFKVDHMGELPEQLEMNMRALERLGALMQTKSEELRVAETRRSELARARNAADSEAGRLQSAEDGLTRTLVAARTSWTADHPEVQRLERELDDLRAKRIAAEERTWAERAERARASQLVSSAQKDIAEIRKQAEVYQRRLDRTPRWTHELSVMQRDYEIARTKYQSVVSRRVEAEIAEELERKGASSLFNVVSAAGVPSEPARPDRVAGLGLALVIALAFASLVAVVVELRDESLRDAAQVRKRLPVPVLAVVPRLDGLRTERRVLAPGSS
ncbi:MAG: chain-length determining protein [Myxococcales bacterium]|nr:chain-length determining protein [Myxococcales bacterium]